MTEQSIWDAPPLPPEDQRLLEAYSKTGRPVDDLAYTQEFEGLIAALGVPATLDSKHFVYQRLLRLRKAGRLPRLGRSSTEAF
jgi:hypothetical protein